MGKDSFVVGVGDLSLSFVIFILKRQVEVGYGYGFHVVGVHNRTRVKRKDAVLNQNRTARRICDQVLMQRFVVVIVVKRHAHHHPFVRQDKPNDQPRATERKKARRTCTYTTVGFLPKNSGKRETYDRDSNHQSAISISLSTLKGACRTRLA